MTAPICAISIVWVKKQRSKKKKNNNNPDLPTHFFQTCYSKHNFSLAFGLINLLYRLWSKNIFYFIIRITYTSLSKSAFKVEKTKRIGNVKKKKDLKHKILQNSIEKLESTSVLSRLRYL